MPNRNLLANPSAIVDLAGYGTTRGNASRITGMTTTKSTGVRLTVTDASSYPELRFVGAAYQPMNFGIDLGSQNFALVIEGVCSAAQSTTVYLIFLDASGNIPTGASSTYYKGVTFTPTANTNWLQRVTGAAPAGTRQVQLWVRQGGTYTVGNTITVSSARLDFGTSTTLVYADDLTSGWVTESNTSGVGPFIQPDAVTAWTADWTKSDVVLAGFKDADYNRQTAAGNGSASGLTWPVAVQAAPGKAAGGAAALALPAQGRRYELEPNHQQFVGGETAFFGDSFYLEPGFLSNDGGGYRVLAQLRQSNSNGSPPIAFEILAGQLRMTGGYGIDTTTAAKYNYSQTLLTSLKEQRWYSLIWQVTKFSQLGGVSRINVWVDGVQVLTNYACPAPTVVPDSIAYWGTYSKLGLYRDPTSAPAATIWHSNSRMALTQAAADPTMSILMSDGVTDEFTAAIGAGWDVVVTNNGTLPPEINGQKLRVYSISGNYYSGLRTYNRFVLKNGRVWMQVPRVAPLGTATNAETRFTLNSAADAGARVVMSYVAQRNVLRMANETGYYDANAVEIAYDAVAHAWWQVREDGTNTYWETSPTGVAGSWTVRRQIATPAWITTKPDERLVVESTRADGDQQYAEFDNVNIVGTALVQKSGTAILALAVAASVASGRATRFGTPQVAVAVGTSSTLTKSTRGPNIRQITMNVGVVPAIYGKVRPGYTAVTNLGVAISSTASKRAIANVSVALGVTIAPLTGRKIAGSTAPVNLAVGVSVAFAAKQRRAITTMGVVVQGQGRGSHGGTSVSTLNVQASPRNTLKSVGGTAQMPVGVQIVPLHTPPRKVYPEIRDNYQDPVKGMRYYLQDIRTGEFLHTEFPLEKEQITLSLSGCDIITGDFAFDIRDVQGISMDGWAQRIHAELDGNIASSGLLLPWTYESRTNSLEANSHSIYPHGIPFQGDREYMQTDPMDIIADIWAHVQSSPMSNLGVSFVKSPTPVRLGTPSQDVSFQASTGATAGADTSQNLDKYVTVKQGDVSSDVWNKLLSMGYQQTGSSPYQNAAAELRARLVSGGSVYEDFTWTGMSVNMSRYNQQLCQGWYGPNNANGRQWPPSATEKQTLINWLAGIMNQGGGQLSVKQRDLITAQGGTPGVSSTTNVAFEAGGPYKLNWFENHDCGSKIDELIRACPADFRDISSWNIDRTNVTHKTISGYPRLGRTLDEVSFVQDENIVDYIPLEEDPEDFATEVIILGAGEGRDRIRGQASLTHPRRVRRVKVIEDKSITSTQIANALAKEILAASQKPVSVKTLLINLNHDYARLGTFGPGDDVPLQLDVRGYGEVDALHRVAKMSWVPKSLLCAVDLVRSDTVRYGVPL